MRFQKTPVGGRGGSCDGGRRKASKKGKPHTLDQPLVKGGQLAEQRQGT